MKCHRVPSHIKLNSDLYEVDLYGELNSFRKALAGMAHLVGQSYCKAKGQAAGLIPGRTRGRTRAWFSGLVPGQGACEKQLIDVSLPRFPLLSPLSKNKLN